MVQQDFPTYGGSHPIASLEISADTLVARGPVLFWGFILTQVAADTITVAYDGRNASGRRRFSLRSATQPTQPVILPHPILFRDGLFVTVDVATSFVDVLFEPLREEMLGERREIPQSVPTE